MPNAGGREGFTTITPYLTHPEREQLIEFVERAFGAAETFRAPDGSQGQHVELRIGDGMLMIGGGPGSQTSTAMLHLYVDDVDAVYQQALAAGATPLAEPSEAGDGDRRGGVADSFGNQWWIATHLGRPE